jgi:hypothetical protein
VIVTAVAAAAAVETCEYMFSEYSVYYSITVTVAVTAAVTAMREYRSTGRTTALFVQQIFSLVVLVAVPQQLQCSDTSTLLVRVKRALVYASVCCAHVCSDVSARSTTHTT